MVRSWRCSRWSLEAAKRTKTRFTVGSWRCSNYSLEAKNNKDQLQKNLEGLNRDLKIKQAESDSKQAQIDDYRTQNESVINAYEDAQKNFYTIGAEIAKHESDLHNINKSEATNLEALERAQKSYKDALQKESAFKDLSPKEKELKSHSKVINTKIFLP